MTPTALDSHIFSGDSPPRELYHDGKLYLHQRCAKCGRDFMREPDSTDWKAVYIGAFKVELLADSVTERWITEECPGRILESDNEQRLTRHQ